VRSALAEVPIAARIWFFSTSWLQGSSFDGLQLLEQIKMTNADVAVVMFAGTAYRYCGRGDHARAYASSEKTFKSDLLHSGVLRGRGDLAPETRS